MNTEPLPVDVLLAGQTTPLALEGLRAAVNLLDGRDPAERDRLVAAHGATIRGIATNGHDGASRELIASLPKLEIIACFSAGVDKIDMAAAAERGVKVTATSEVLSDDVADVAIALILQVLRRFAHADRFVRDGSWHGGQFPLGRSAKGMRLGILGMGTIGGEIAERARAMKMTVAYTSRSPKPALAYSYVPSLRQLAEQSDILVVCCPATPETFHMVDADVLAALGPDGFLINIARGSVVDEAALVAALKAGTVGGAGLDVFEDEPRPHPELLGMEHVALSPHIGSGTHQTRAAMGQHMIDSLRKQFAQG